MNQFTIWTICSVYIEWKYLSQQLLISEDIFCYTSQFASASTENARSQGLLWERNFDKRFHTWYWKKFTFEEANTIRLFLICQKKKNEINTFNTDATDDSVMYLTNGELTQDLQWMYPCGAPWAAVRWASPLPCGPRRTGHCRRRSERTSAPGTTETSHHVLTVQVLTYTLLKIEGVSSVKTIILI